MSTDDGHDVQQSTEWHRWRARGLGSSDAPVVMRASPYLTPFGLWQEKTGRVERPPPNQYMLRGHALEPAARRLYEKHTGTIVRARTLTHPEHAWMRASLDGLDYAGGRVVEIKCPGPEHMLTAIEGRCPAAWYPQLQHQLAVAGVAVADLWVYDGEHAALVAVPRDDSHIALLIEAERAFWRCVEEDTPPPLTERDCMQTNDPEFLAGAELWLQANAKKVEAERQEEAGKEAMARAAARLGHPRIMGGGAVFARYERKGCIDYGRIPELATVDVEAYRKAPIQVDRVTRTKAT